MGIFVLERDLNGHILSSMREPICQRHEI